MDKRTFNVHAIGMFVSGFALMAAQVSLTRLMAAAIGSHGTFAILGCVMLGLAASGTHVFVHRMNDRQHSPAQALSMAALAFVGSTVLFLFLTSLSFIGNQPSLAILCAGCFVLPFYYVGYFITLVLEQNAETASKLYAADLLGAALGAIGVVWMLDLVAPPISLSIIALICAIVPLMFDRTKLSVGVVSACTVMVIALIGFPNLAKLRYAGTTHIDEVKWSKWDHLGQASVLDYPEGLSSVIEDPARFGLPHLKTTEERANFIALGWAMSRNYRGPIPDTKYIRIDSGVGTPVVSHTVADTDILQWDVTAAGFVVAGKDAAAIVGTGGGRDVRTAKSFGVKRVAAFEINPKVVEAVETIYRDLSGGPYSLPNVTPHIGDARSEIRGTGPFDIIELPMTDTFSATSSGALVFSENGLYTVEAFKAFAAELNDGGILSVSRFYSDKTPGETGRIVATARDLIKLQKGKPTEQVAVVYGNSLVSKTSGVANVLVKKTPFTPDEIARLRTWAAERDFELLYPTDTPRAAFSVNAILTEDASFYEESIADVSPIYDDRPFFYDAIKPWKSIVKAVEVGKIEIVSISVRGLVLLFVILLFASKIFVIDPIRRSEDGVGMLHWTSLFYASIGFGFLAVELAVIQRCTLYLGHPTYALTVVISALLLSSALGSALSGRIETKHAAKLAAATVAAIVFVALVQPVLFTMTQNESFWTRVIAVVVVVAPLGLTMGTMYPTGLRILSERGEKQLVSWSWAINGSAGVVATIAGMFIAMRVGYTALLGFGALAYVVALVVAHRAQSAK